MSILGKYTQLLLYMQYGVFRAYFYLQILPESMYNFSYQNFMPQRFSLPLEIIHIFL